MLPDAEEVDPQIVGKDRLVDHVADDLCLRQQLAILTPGDIAEGIQTEFESLCHALS
jgi:hypothetical protein